jgi:hypothetical protein
MIWLLNLEWYSMELNVHFVLSLISIIIDRDILSTLDSVMDSDDTLTDKEYNCIREAHDYISNARDILERLTKQKD